MDLVSFARHVPRLRVPHDHYRWISSYQDPRSSRESELKSEIPMYLSSAVTQDPLTSMSLRLGLVQVPLSSAPLSQTRYTEVLHPLNDLCYA